MFREAKRSEKEKDNKNTVDLRVPSNFFNLTMTGSFPFGISGL